MVSAPIAIGIGGTHATGKTAHARRIEMEPRSAAYTVTHTGDRPSARHGSDSRR